MRENLSYSKEKPSTIQEMFGSIAKDYDKTNSVLSFGLNKRWNRELVKSVSKDSPSIFLDLCSGSGEIAFSFMDKFPNTPKTVYLLDFCQELLACAKEKNLKRGNNPHFVTYLQADAEKIPLLDQSVDSIAVAYGIRNIRSLDNCFKEAYRVLKPGGTFGILELTEPPSKILKPFHNFYLKWILPYVGGALTKNLKAYSYLHSSIKNFMKPSEIKELLVSKGFNKVEIKPLMGGIATLLIAEKD